jgi:uroporphyrinogen decarboxylase
MIKQMTSKERMLTAFRNEEEPDMVPVSPDMSNMIPAKLTGKPFWDIYLYNNPPLWQAYIEAVKRFKFDGWQYAGQLGTVESIKGSRIIGDSDSLVYVPGDSKGEVKFRTVIVDQTSYAITTRTYLTTPKGTLWSETIYYRDNPPWNRRKFIKDLEKEFDYVQYFFPDPSKLPGDAYWEMANALGDLGTTGLAVILPGFQSLFEFIDGGLEEICRLYLSKRHLIKEFCKIIEEYAIAYVERGLQFQPEHIMLGASGLLTLQSPSVFRELSLNAIKKITRMAKEADVPSHLHSCGRERYIVEVAATETDLSSIEPLEPPPHGDCDLAEIKEKFGKRLALKGNLDTRKFLFATPKEIEAMAKWCIDVAAPGGGFVLSTGDQLGRDTPEENIYALIKTARRYGKYPLRK